MSVELPHSSESNKMDSFHVANWKSKLSNDAAKLRERRKYLKKKEKKTLMLNQPNDNDSINNHKRRKMINKDNEESSNDMESNQNESSAEISSSSEMDLNSLDDSFSSMFQKPPDQWKLRFPRNRFQSKLNTLSEERSRINDLKKNHSILFRQQSADDGSSSSGEDEAAEKDSVEEEESLQESGDDDERFNNEKENGEDESVVDNESLEEAEESDEELEETNQEDSHQPPAENSHRNVEFRADFFGRLDEGKDDDDDDDDCGYISTYKYKKLKLNEKFKNKGKEVNIDLFDETEVEVCNIGEMSSICKVCKAKYFKLEETSNRGDLKFTRCCSKGTIKIAGIKPPPESILSLLTGEADNAGMFLRNAKAFNAKVSMASVSLNNFKFGTGGYPAIRVSGTMHHNLGPLCSGPDTPSSFLQVFFHDSTQNQPIISSESFTRAESEMLDMIRRELKEHNQYLKLFSPMVNQYKDAPNYYIKMR